MLAVAVASTLPDTCEINYVLVTFLASSFQETCSSIVYENNNKKPNLFDVRVIIRYYEQSDLASNCL